MTFRQSRSTFADYASTVDKGSGCNCDEEVHFDPATGLARRPALIMRFLPEVTIRGGLASAGGANPLNGAGYEVDDRGKKRGNSGVA